MRTLLIANRGEIARRVMRTARRVGLQTVAVFTPVDARSPHSGEADVAVAVQDYLDIDGLVAAAKMAGADAVHPGYGFLSENAAFATAVIDAGLTWVGPNPDTIQAMGNKVEAKRRMAAAGVPVLRGGAVEDAAMVGYPLVVKAAAGGGGKGMRLVTSADQLPAAVEGARREAMSVFGDSSVFLERWLASPRHVEVQIFGDQHGGVVHLGERECSIQRRHQKVIEEAPSPGIGQRLRQQMLEAAITGATAMGYVSAGTMEFLAEGDEFFFLEMNTRLQVEHPVTEAVTGLDLVELQLHVAAGRALPMSQDDVTCRGHAVEARLYAEDPSEGYLPSPGTVARWLPGSTPEIRYDSSVEDGSVVAPDYDPLIAKVVAWSDTREEAAARLARALRDLQIHGVRTNRDLLVAVLEDPDFHRGATTTDFLEQRPELADPPSVPGAHLVAAVTAAALDRRRRAGVLGFLPSGWRNLPALPQHVSLEAHGVAAAMEILYTLGGHGRVRLDVDGHVLEAVVETVGDGTWVDVTIDGLRRRCSVHVDEGHTWVNSALGQSTFRPLPRFPELASDAAGRGPMAPLPGTVVDVLVTVGDEVAAGTTLVVLEAMKMEHRIVASADAVVTDVCVEVGERVDAGHVLVVLQ